MKKAFKTAAQLGYRVGDLFRITANHDHKRLNTAVGNHKFAIGAQVMLKEDDNSAHPLFESPVTGESWWVNVNCVVQEARATGPTAGVHWAEAPEEATHYSLYEHHIYHWYRLHENGKWSFFSESSDRWIGQNVVVPDVEDKMLPIPAGYEVVKMKAEVKAKSPVRDRATVAAELAKVQKRMTRVGAKQGRAQARLELANAEMTELRDRQQALKVELASTPEPKVFASLQELVALAKDTKQWKTGMRVRAVREIASNITNGKVYELKGIQSDGGLVNVIDDSGQARVRLADRYELVWQDLVDRVE